MEGGRRREDSGGLELGMSRGEGEEEVGREKVYPLSAAQVGSTCGCTGP